jgi:hypothetical protein
MDPFRPGHEWYEPHWYSWEPAKTSLRVTSVVAGIAALAFAVWFR